MSANTPEKTKDNTISEQLDTARRAGDAMSGYARMLLCVVSPYVSPEDKARIERLRKSVERWESLRSVEFVVGNEVKL